jgi:peroxiredoxin
VWAEQSVGQIVLYYNLLLNFDLMKKVKEKSQRQLRLKHKFPPSNGGKDMVKIGQEIPDFEMDIYHQDEIKKIKLADYRGKWLVLLFYPADFTFVCPTELEEAAGFYPKFRESEAEVISISTDTAFVHKAWHDVSPAIKKITYPMGADPTGQLCRMFGTYQEEDGLSCRASFIIDPDGVLKAFELHDNSIGRSSAEILRKLQAAKYVREADGEVCPANWKPGDKTLKPGFDLIGKI